VPAFYIAPNGQRKGQRPNRDQDVGAQLGEPILGHELPADARACGDDGEMKAGKK
jgi:hypothetical protein